MAKARRVDELLSSLGYCSRKEAQVLCDAGRVTLDGEEVAAASARVDPLKLRVDGEPLDAPQGLLLVLNKPPGWVCSHRERDGRLIYELLPERLRRRDPPLSTVGRLDKDTTGVLLVTDVGSLVHELTSPRRHVEKVYVATLDGPLTDAITEAFASGILLDNESAPTLPATVRAVGENQVEVVVTEGKYHQIKRMFASCGRQVHALHRTRFGPYTADGLEPGQWRALPLPDTG